jgi:hypothetical protein
MYNVVRKRAKQLNRQNFFIKPTIHININCSTC